MQEQYFDITVKILLSLINEWMYVLFAACDQRSDYVEQVDLNLLSIRYEGKIKSS